MIGVVAVVVATLLWFVFDYGRERGGFDSAEAVKQQRDLQNTIAALESERAQLKKELSRIHRSGQVDGVAAEVVRQRVLASQDEVAHIKEELAFYRNIVSPEDRARGVNIQSLKLNPVDLETRHFTYRIAMVQLLDSRRVTGRMRVRVSGTHDGVATVLERSAFAQQPDKGHKLGFKSFQIVQGSVRLTPGFVPEAVEIEVSGVGKGDTPLRRSFDWRRNLAPSAQN